MESGVWATPYLPDATPPVVGTKISGLELWIGVREFPSDARLGYWLAIDDRSPMNDPANPLQQPESTGVGSQLRSELRMPRYVRSPYRDPHPWVMKGNLSDNVTFNSTQLGYPINYRVYTPYTLNPCPYGRGAETGAVCSPKLGRAANGREYPVLIFSDGWEYVGFGIKDILDNLIAAQMIPPVIAVFIDPRDVQTGVNNRGLQYLLQKEQTGEFLTKELIPLLDSKYNTRRDRGGRGVIGFSLSGFFTSYLCFGHYQTFGMCGFQSPVPPVGDYAPTADVGDLIANSPVFPVKIAMETGTLDLALTADRQYRDFLQGKGYSFFYQEVSSGHSWGHWADNIDDVLIYLLNRN